MPTVTAVPNVPVVTGVSPIETQYSLYGHVVPLSVGGVVRIGCEIIAGPWIADGLASFIVSAGVPADPTGTRELREIAFDSDVVWQGSQVGAGSPSSAGFSVEPFTCRFYDGKLTQSADPIETAHFGANAVAYRPQILLAVENLPLKGTKFGKIPYVALLIADTSGDDVNYGEAFQRLAYSPFVGYTSSEFETSGITDGLVKGGMIFADDAEFLATLQLFGRFYPNWDILQTDKLRLVDRGSEVRADIILDKSRITEKAVVSRQGEDAIRKDLELSTIDPDADYTIVPYTTDIPREPVAVTASVGVDRVYLPAVMDASTRAAVATLTKYTEERQRKTIRFTSMIYGLQMEPGALLGTVNMIDGSPGETFKIKETLHGANLVVEGTAVSMLRCAIDRGPSDVTVVSQSDVTYDIGLSVNVDIPAFSVGDLLIAAVMHRDTLTPSPGWTLVDHAAGLVTSASVSHQISVFRRVAQLGDTTTTWTQATSQRIGAHIIAIRSVSGSIDVVDHQTSHLDDTGYRQFPLAEATATASGQIGVAFSTTALQINFAPAAMNFIATGGTQTTAQSQNDNRLCGGYIPLNAGDKTTGIVTTDAVAGTGAWAAVSLVIG
ncbi:hypothetical protein ABIF26_006461 [Bradyrhizobium elkanii]|uniref:hypothetical protein n=1 Tax=Bradyrhizobium elkanii TaxID=29448 RepID=UPI003513D97F